jgi:sn-glycerol 3-phosphate transport system permease protein
MTTLSPQPTTQRPLKVATPYLLIAPTLGLVILFTLYPAVKAIRDSLYQPGRRDNPPTFVGLENYIDIFNSSHRVGSVFTEVLGNTLIFTAGTVLIGLPLALVMAMLLNRKIRLMPLWRFSIFYPSLLPMIGAANLWVFLYANEVGVINRVLTEAGITRINWLGDENIALYSIIAVNIWKQVGYYMIFFLAGLQGIPKDIYEAADLDGATFWQQFTFITLPLLRRTTLFVTTIAFIFAFQTVEQLAVFSFRYPANSGNLMLYYIYELRNARTSQGYVNAMTVILVGILLVFTITNFVLSERGGREDD